MIKPRQTVRLSGIRAMRFGVWPLAAWACCFFLSGAGGDPMASRLRAADVPAENVYAQPPKLLASLQRVALLPIASATQLADLPEGCEWTGAESMPTNFFPTLQRRTGCDAVLFCELTEFKAYPPLVMGWRFKLVDVRTRFFGRRTRCLTNTIPFWRKRKRYLRRLATN
jgi:hypothetical protein